MYQVVFSRAVLLTLVLTTVSCVKSKKPDPFFAPYPFSVPEGYPKFSKGFAKEQIELHRKRNRHLVQQCIAMTSEIKHEIKVDRIVPYACYNYAMKYSINELNPKYDIKVENGHLSVNLRVAPHVRSPIFGTRDSLDILPLPEVAPEYRDKLINRAQACIPTIQTKFGQYGINLSLEIQERAYYKAIGVKAHYKPNLIDRNERSRELTWFAGDAHFCDDLLMAIGYQFGFAPEAHTRYCNHPIFTSKEEFPMSYMGADVLAEGPDMKDFFPRHLATLLEPICPEIVNKVDSSEITPDDVLAEHGLTYAEYEKIWIETNGRDSLFYLSSEHTSVHKPTRR